MLFIKIAVLFPSLIPCLKTPSDDRENTEKTPTQLPASKKALFLILLPKKVVSLPKKVDSFPKNVSFLCPLIPNHIRVFSPLNSAGSPITLVALWGALKL